ncbi:hypothetical protein JYU34_020680 [Plutella xylostella]|uniref:Uncharacterized protein n=1 Tax=Plutella xylostella TaxID=51655 RepID=A0ABQ7PUX3_PLUXY|nr:hypothetical protein JYU34_020680 [Plutella xylostella]
MWWRILTFCVLVCLILFVVLSCIHGRPVVHLFFQRCCEETIENDNVLFENYGNNYLKERLIGIDLIIEDGNETLVREKELDEIIDHLREKMNVHDPSSRSVVLYDDNDIKNVTNSNVEDSGGSAEVTTKSDNLVRKDKSL